MTGEGKPCHKPKFDSRMEAREKLLDFWRRGKFEYKKTHWCNQCQKWHLSRSKTYGHNPNYGEVR